MLYAGISLGCDCWRLKIVRKQVNSHRCHHQWIARRWQPSDYILSSKWLICRPSLLQSGPWCDSFVQPSPGVTIAALSVWAQGSRTAAAVTVVTTWRQEPVWSAPSAKMVSCQLSYFFYGPYVCPFCTHLSVRLIGLLCSEVTWWKQLNYFIVQWRQGHFRNSTFLKHRLLLVGF